jgi:anti-sigma-K factor RskA
LQEDRKIWKGVAVAVIAVAVIAVAQSIVNYYSRSGDTAALAQLTAQTQVEVVQLVKIFGERFKAEDTAVEQDAKRCRQGHITDREICGAAGVMIRP